MTTQIMDVIRGNFLERQLNCFPKEIVSIIREYDGFYRNNFTNKVIVSLNSNVIKFWEKNILNYVNKKTSVSNSNHIQNLEYYKKIIELLMFSMPAINYNNASNDDAFMFD